MRILDRYIMKQMIRTMLIGSLAFLVVFISLDMVENIDDFVDSNASITTVLKYYSFQVPYIFNLTLPIATLIACLFTVGQMARYTELIAMRASGIRFLRIIVPLMVVGMLTSLTSLAIGELIEPESNAIVRAIKANEIKKPKKTVPRGKKTNVSYRGRSGVFYFTPSFDTRRNIMTNVVIEKTSGDRLIYRINAKRAVWRDSVWVFVDAWVRWFDENGDVDREAYIPEGTISGLCDKPGDIVREQRKPEEMGYVQLHQLIKRVEESGGDPTRYRVGLNMKLAFPFTNLVVILIGSPLSARIRRGGIALGVGRGLSITFIYYGFIRVGQTLGDHGILPPFVAAWLGNLVFAACGIILILHAEKY